MKSNGTNGRRLLLTSCSARKREVEGARAIDLYDGPSFRIIRKHTAPDLDVLILSAKYGLIRAQDQIAWYEQRMTAGRAAELREMSTERLRNALDKGGYSSVMVNLGRVYQTAIDWRDLGYDGDVVWTKGPIGVRLHQLKEWLASDGRSGRP